jgi:hypothetical protein
MVKMEGYEKYHDLDAPPPVQPTPAQPAAPPKDFLLAVLLAVILVVCNCIWVMWRIEDDSRQPVMVHRLNDLREIPDYSNRYYVTYRIHVKREKGTGTVEVLIPCNASGLPTDAGMLQLVQAVRDCDPRPGKMDVTR